MKPSTRLILLAVLLQIVSFHGTAQDHAPAPASPVVTILEFSDFQCPFCARQAPELRRLQAEYAGRVIVIFKNFPLSIHAHARAAHQAAVAAGEQGKFWEMHDLIFAHPGRLSAADFEYYAGQLGLDKGRWYAALRDGAANTVIENDIAEGKILASPPLQRCWSTAAELRAYRVIRP